MARGAAQQAQRKQRPKQSRKQATPAYEQAMFFPRLRRQAKWVFVLLALAFGIGFVAFGVGSGSGGISDILQGGFFNGSSSTSGRIKDKQKEIDRRPKDVSLYLDLAGMYQQDQKTGQAVATLRRALKVAPNDFDVLSRIASIDNAEAHRLVNEYQNLRAALSEKVVPPPYASGSPLTDQPLQDTYTQALQAKVGEAQSRALTALQGVERSYQRAAKAAVGTSNEASAQLQIAAVAIDALTLASQPADASVAITAYRRYLKIVPNGTATADVRQRIAQLEAYLGQTGR
jgi:tetratricopeptide (TPR) repeat protein